jgi:DNA-binding transcriptional regulator YiaG
MTGTEFRKILKRLKLTQVGAAKLLGVDDSTSRRWIADASPIPRAVIILLRLMVKYQLSADDITPYAHRIPK